MSVSARPRLLTALAAVGVLAGAVAVAIAAPGALRTADAATCATPTAIPSSGGSPWPAGNVLAAGGLTTDFTPSGSDKAWLPRTFGADVVNRDANGVDSQTKQITEVYSRHLDLTSPPEGLIYGAMVSSNSGTTFTQAPSVPANVLGEIGTLMDGRLLAVPFIVNGGVTVSGSTISFPMQMRLSADKGATWQQISATSSFTDADLPAALSIRKVSALNGVFAAGRPIQKTNGTIVLPIYFSFDKSGGGSVLWVAMFTTTPTFNTDGSVDTSSPWTFTMHPVTVNATQSFDETAVVERADGSLLEVTRGDGANGAQLSWKTSGNDGVTWSAFSDLHFDDQPSCPVFGVFPQLTMMPNGLLVLSSGRPNNYLAISTDASGTLWRREQTTYSNHPDQTWAYGSSGYTSLTPLTNNRLLQFVDNCQAPNGVAGQTGCVTGSGYDHDQHYRLLHRDIKALIPDMGKIDIADKLKHGTAHLDTDLTGVPPVNAVTPPTPYGSAPAATDATRTNYWANAEGATDGSNTFWSGALSSKADGTGSYTLSFDRSYHFTKIGLELLPGAATTAHVFTSADGATWNPAVDVSTPGDRSMRYYAFDATAQYVRVTTDAAKCTLVGGPDKCSMINELELYSTTDSFENDPDVPHGLANLACVRVTQPGGNGDPNHDSQYAVRLKDMNDATYCPTDALGKLTYPEAGVSVPTVTPATSRTLDGSIYQVSNTYGILFNINGVRSSDKGVQPEYHIALDATGHWTVWDKPTNTWTKIGGTGGDQIPLKTWARFRIHATNTAATLSIVDTAGAEHLVGNIPKQETAVAFDTIQGYDITSGNSAKAGDEAVIDDLTFE
jgi:hypothetical protein